MIETSTTSSNSLPNNMAQISTTVEDLSKEEQGFYAAITNKLDAIVKKPRQATISKILDYSRSR